jgi:hypothetical protein
MTPRTLKKADVVAELRFRQRHARAEWAEKTLPDVIDTVKNASLLQMLGIDPDTVATGEADAPAAGD